jgi:hypothetical protein
MGMIDIIISISVVVLYKEIEWIYFHRNTYMQYKLLKVSVIFIVNVGT